MKNQLGMKRRIRHHFTIAEMMVVIALSMIILALAVAAWVNADGGVQMKRATRVVNAQLNLARSKAIADRKPYRVRFYQEGDQQYCGIFDENNDAVANEPAQPMPGQSLAVLENNVTEGYIEFDRQGRVSDARHVASENGFYTIRMVILLDDGERDEDAYFKIAVNPFNGRSTITYHEENN